jgi:hypothetical protein
MPASKTCKCPTCLQKGPDGVEFDAIRYRAHVASTKAQTNDRTNIAAVSICDLTDSTIHARATAARLQAEVQQTQSSAEQERAAFLTAVLDEEPNLGVTPMPVIIESLSQGISRLTADEVSRSSPPLSRKECKEATKKRTRDLSERYDAMEKRLNALDSEINTTISTLRLQEAEAELRSFRTVLETSKNLTQVLQLKKVGFLARISGLQNQLEAVRTSRPKLKNAVVIYDTGVLFSVLQVAANPNASYSTPISCSC